MLYSVLSFMVPHDSTQVGVCIFASRAPISPQGVTYTTCRSTRSTCEYTTHHSTCEYTTHHSTCEYITRRSTCEYTTHHSTCEYTTRRSTCEYTTHHSTCEYTTCRSTCEYTTRHSTCEYTTYHSTCEYTTRHSTQQPSCAQGPPSCIKQGNMMSLQLLLWPLKQPWPTACWSRPCSRSSSAVRPPSPARCVCLLASSSLPPSSWGTMPASDSLWLSMRALVAAACLSRSPMDASGGGGAR